MKVSLYVRQHSSRKYRKATPKEAMGTTYVLRYGSTWETTDAKNWTEANAAVLRRKIELSQGWQPKPKVRAQVSTDLMLDAAIDDYLSEIKSGRKKKTHQAYQVALKYFYESTGNKPMKDIPRGDLIKFSAFLRDDKEQAPRSCWNKFSNVMSFLKHHDITGKSLKIKAHDWDYEAQEILRLGGSLDESCR